MVEESAWLNTKDFPEPRCLPWGTSYGAVEHSMKSNSGG